MKNNISQIDDKIINSILRPIAAYHLGVLFTDPISRMMLFDYRDENEYDEFILSWRKNYLPHDLHKIFHLLNISTPDNLNTITPFDIAKIKEHIHENYYQYFILGININIFIAMHIFKLLHRDTHIYTNLFIQFINTFYEDFINIKFDDNQMKFIREFSIKTVRIMRELNISISYENFFNDILDRMGLIIISLVEKQGLSQEEIHKEISVVDTIYDDLHDVQARLMRELFIKLNNKAKLPNQDLNELIHSTILSSDTNENSIKINHVDDIVSILHESLSKEPNEVLFLALIDESNNLIELTKIFEGSDSSVAIPINELFYHISKYKSTIKDVYLIHNHPSGHTLLSLADLKSIKNINKEIHRIFNKNINIDVLAIGTLRENSFTATELAFQFERIDYLLNKGYINSQFSQEYFLNIFNTSDELTDYLYYIRFNAFVLELFEYIDACDTGDLEKCKSIFSKPWVKKHVLSFDPQIPEIFELVSAKEFKDIDKFESITRNILKYLQPLKKPININQLL